MAVAATPYRAIAHGIRREILDLLRGGSLSAGAIARQFPNVSRPAVSKHLSVLREATLVAARKRGRERIYSLNAAPLQEVDDWIGRYEEHWQEQLQALKAHLEAKPQKEETQDEG